MKLGNLSYELMWQIWSRNIPYPMPWWLQSYFRDWPVRWMRVERAFLSLPSGECTAKFSSPELWRMVMTTVTAVCGTAR